MLLDDAGGAQVTRAVADAMHAYLLRSYAQLGADYRRGLGVRFGHFYAHRLCTALGPDPADGVVRASLVHYDTADGVERLVATLAELLA